MDIRKKINLSKETMAVSGEGLILVAVGLMVIVVVAFMSPTISVLSGKTMAATMEVPAEEGLMVAYVDVDELNKEFMCECCGKNIGDCDCGMAQERKAYVGSLARKKLGDRDIKKAMVQKYTEKILFNEALAAEIKGELIAEAPSDRAVIEISPASFDAGEVSMAKGIVETVFQVKNSGQTDLAITGLETSCMCTTAILKNEGAESPVFGMHDNPTDWSTTIAPGGTAELVVMFDPNAHGPEATGPVTRTISVKSSDLIDSSKSARFEAVVVK